MLLSRLPDSWKPRVWSASRSLARVMRAYRPMMFPPYGPRISSLIDRYDDNVRYSTLALALHRIESECISGAIAEVGVFRGMTSSFIRRTSNPSRKFYLFDTFEGFAEADLEGRSDARFRDTSVEEVLKKVGDTRNVEVRKGYFPDSAAGLENEKFSLVMLDVDLYAASLATLRFFYSRLSPGGYFFMHDYNSLESERGVSRAANEFLADKPEFLLEIPDICGTALFRKIESAGSAETSRAAKL